MTPEIEKRIKAVKAGRVPTGYKKTKIGIVPKEWEVFPLKDVSTELHDVAGKNHYEPLSISAGIGFVNQTNKFGKDISGAQYAKYTVIRKNDFSYNKGNSKKYPQGCIYRLKDREIAVVPNVFESFRLNCGEPEYFEHLFINGFFNRQLSSKINHGVRDDGLLNLRGDDFYSCQVPFPPLSEQKKIAEILSAQDKIIELKEKLIVEKQKQKHCLMKELLDETAKKPFKLNDVIVDKKKWKKIKLEDFASLKTGTLPTFTAEKGLYPFVNAGSDYSGYTNEYNCEGDVITTPSRGQGGIGEVFYQRSPFWLGPLSYRIKVSQGNSASYVFYIMLFNKRKIKDETKTGSIPAVNARDLGKLKYWLPPFPEQQAIAAILSSADEEISLLQRDLEQEKLKKKSLMQLLLTGLVRV